MARKDELADEAWSKELRSLGHAMSRLCRGWQRYYETEDVRLNNIALKRNGPGTWLCVASGYNRQEQTWVVCFFNGLTPGDALLAFAEAANTGDLKWKPDKFGQDRRVSDYLLV